LKLFIAKINNEKSVDPIIKNMAGYSIIDPVIINCTGMDEEIKDYNGSLLGSLRVMFEKERKKAFIIAVIIKDTQVDYAVKAVEQEVGILEDSKENDVCLALPLDMIKGIK
jgi:hypothetical protein